VKEHAPRPRVKIKHGHGGGHHGGAWKVAYSDFVTTMMALFIVLWIVGQNAGTREAVARYFRDPGAFREGAAPTVVPGGAGLLPPGVPPTTGERESAAEEAALAAAGEEFLEALKRAGLFERLREQVRVEVTAEGLRVELAERDDAPLFQVGSAAIMPPMRQILDEVAHAVGALPNPVVVEGHTDARPYVRGHEYSNWELSTDRAHSARRVMEAAGLAPSRIERVAGHADRLLRVPADPRHAANRRITILVRRLHAATPAPTTPAHKAEAGQHWGGLRQPHGADHSR
jgi:chemotaxis protein MotB